MSWLDRLLLRWSIALSAAPTVVALGQGQPCYADLPDGSVSGLTGLSGGTREFRGLPFAKPPVGYLRWRPPVRNEPWEGTYDATTYPPPCAQPAPDNTVHGNESCLVCILRALKRLTSTQNQPS
jgi:para-nitrobenzyl esterase|eukprot:COSAG02_NODE_6268_length_3693_cov_210.252643_1_plen_124_part_00